ncbi:MAG: hypothetical protein Q8W45_06965 [Candidatus Palauibacterales bacterium]|nr:hypothetical protein [Candidatus Palauibacterales bacterium]MDP2483005.1 hypothetical protein [Candidatus Palauibacterales bacterium]
MTVLFFVADPSFGCAIDCLLNHHAADVNYHDSGRHPSRGHTALGQTAPTCHGTTLQAPHRAPARGDLSPACPVCAVATLPVLSGEAPGELGRSTSFRAFIDIPPTPPPRT